MSSFFLIAPFFEVQWGLEAENVPSGWHARASIIPAPPPAIKLTAALVLGLPSFPPTLVAIAYWGGLFLLATVERVEGKRSIRLAPFAKCLSGELLGLPDHAMLERGKHWSIESFEKVVCW